jgi:hypothetical protein
MADLLSDDDKNFIDDLAAHVRTHRDQLNAGQHLRTYWMQHNHGMAWYVHARLRLDNTVREMRSNRGGMFRRGTHAVATACSEIFSWRVVATSSAFLALLSSCIGLGLYTHIPPEMLTPVIASMTSLTGCPVTTRVVSDFIAFLTSDFLHLTPAERAAAIRGAERVREHVAEEKKQVVNPLHAVDAPRQVEMELAAPVRRVFPPTMSRSMPDTWITPEGTKSGTGRPIRRITIQREREYARTLGKERARDIGKRRKISSASEKLF